MFARKVRRSNVILTEVEINDEKKTLTANVKGVLGEKILDVFSNLVHDLGTKYEGYTIYAKFQLSDDKIMMLNATPRMEGVFAL